MKKYEIDLPDIDYEEMAEKYDHFNVRDPFTGELIPVVTGSGKSYLIEEDNAPLIGVDGEEYAFVIE